MAEVDDMAPVASIKPVEERGGYRIAAACAPEYLTDDFVPSEDWKEITPGQNIPAGCKINLDITTGKRYGKLIPKSVVIVEDLAYLTEQVTAGVMIDSADAKQLTFLHRACTTGALDCVKYLVEAKANINLLSKSFTPLQLAIMRGHMEVVKFLVEEAKVDMGVWSKSGKLPLHLAASSGALPMVKYLLSRKKAKPNLTTRSGDTALHEAGPMGHLAVVEYLVEKGADVEIQNEEGKTAAECCDDYEQEEVANFLRDVVTQRALKDLLGDLDIEDGGASKKTKKNKNKSKPPPKDSDGDVSAAGGGGGAKSGKGKKGKKGKKNKGKNGGGKRDQDDDAVTANDGLETVSGGGGLAVVENGGGGGGGPPGGGGLALSGDQPVRSLPLPPKKKVEKKVVKKEETSDEDSDDDDSEILDADLD